VTKLEWAYLAGFIDADGHIGVYTWMQKDTYERSKVVVCITNTNKEVMDWLTSKLGGHYHLTNKNAPRHHKSTWRWTVQGHSARPVLRKTLQFLRVKKKQAELGLEFIKTMRKLPFGTALAEEDRAIRKRVHQQIRRLNKRGRPR
jgi:frataxin-like iron-binding protein CyaY